MLIKCIFFSNLEDDLMDQSDDPLNLYSRIASAFSSIRPRSDLGILWNFTIIQKCFCEIKYKITVMENNDKHNFKFCKVYFTGNKSKYFSWNDYSDSTTISVSVSAPASPSITPPPQTPPNCTFVQAEKNVPKRINCHLCGTFLNKATMKLCHCGLYQHAKCARNKKKKICKKS